MPEQTDLLAGSALRTFYRAETGEPEPTGQAICWFCAGPCSEDAPEPADVVRSTFSDMARARAGGDGPICPACEFYLDFKLLRPGGKRGMGLYTKTVVVQAGPVRPSWREWGREEMLPDLLEIEAQGLPYGAYFTCNYSKQKHVLPWARLSTAGERYPWISTDQGDVHLAPDWPALAWCVAWLWDRGYPKLMAAAGQLTAYHLAGSDEPAMDLAAARALAAAPGPLTEYVSYIVTEDNRGWVCDTLAGQACPLLRRHDAGAADRLATRGDPQRGGGPELQKPLPQTVVGDRGGAGAAGGDDVGEPDPVEQYRLL